MKATCSEIQNTDSQLFTTFDTFLTLVVKLFLPWIIQVKQNYKKKAGVCIISFSCTKYVLPHFFSPQDYLGRQHIIEAPSIKATKDVHISLKGGEKLLKLSIPVWCWQWNCSRNGFLISGKWVVPMKKIDLNDEVWGCRNWDSSHGNTEMT